MIQYVAKAVSNYYADLAPTAANILISSGQAKLGIAGTTIARGNVLKGDANSLLLAEAGDTAVKAIAIGIALSDGAVGQYVSYMELHGAINLGAVLTVGTIYVLSATAGKIAPFADLVSTDYITILGIASSTSILQFSIAKATAIQVP